MVSHHSETIVVGVLFKSHRFLEYGARSMLELLRIESFDNQGLDI